MKTIESVDIVLHVSVNHTKYSGKGYALNGPSDILKRISIMAVTGQSRHFLQLLNKLRSLWCHLSKPYTFATDVLYLIPK